ncbi:diacylglycerol kinase (macronuclear) [Tetrahymena thermophila SB210]|uniref:Diacylglycerol kinase n=1 Tax=Tetrahymena thermophila (strain SB210) TaxID=312017 RepID=A4VCY7_TETTS|nr:diacylglycerol kinase [Tetrahymena thermophila SB210]EDK31399.2 diacylglycerol kinase [Tetrahymena thermophila SB210]|eukprot:XP_001470645.2 diacylglycerol kinase [Tetrahymena thermophila SB210]
MQSEANYVRMGDNKQYQIVPDQENQINIQNTALSTQNQFHINHSENHISEVNDNREKQYLNYSNENFPFMVQDKNGSYVINEQIYLKLDKKEGKKFEWKLLIEKEKIVMKSLIDNSQIEVNWQDLLGASYQQVNVGGHIIYKLSIYLMKKDRKTCYVAYNRYLSSLDFYVETESRAQNLKKLIQNYARNKSYFDQIQQDLHQKKIPDFPKKLLVFINPVGGDGSAQKKWNKISHLLEYAGYTYLLVLTKYKDHAHQYVNEIPAEQLIQYAGIVTVSGDGLPHEIVNGLFKRADKDFVCSKVALGVLPGGSGNALINSILHEINEPKTLEGATYLICKGSIKDMDMIQMQTKANPCIYSFLSLAWAYIADVDLNSEHLRFLARLRFDVMGVYRALFQKKYSGVLYTTDEDLQQLPDINQPIDIQQNRWEEVKERSFKYFMIMNVPLITQKDLNAPNAHINDGFMDLQYLESSKGWGQLVKYALNFQSGSHFDKKTQLPASGQKFTYKRVKAFRLQSVNQQDLGLLSIDGESYTSDVIQGRILPSILKVFSF